MWIFSTVQRIQLLVGICWMWKNTFGVCGQGLSTSQISAALTQRGRSVAHIIQWKTTIKTGKVRPLIESEFHWLIVTQRAKVWFEQSYQTKTCSQKNWQQ